MTLLDASGRVISSGPIIDTKAERDAPDAYAHLERQPVINLKYHSFRHVVGSITVWGTWLLNTPEKENCLVLLPSAGLRRRKFRRSERPVPCIVRESAGWLWFEPPIGDEIEAALIAHDFALLLGLNPAKNSDVFRVITAVRDHLDELYTMPLCPPTDSIVAGEVQMRLSDGRVIEEELHHAT